MEEQVNSDGEFLNGKTYITIETSELSSNLLFECAEQSNPNCTENLLENENEIGRLGENSDQNTNFTSINNPLADLLKEWNLFDELYYLLKLKGVTVDALRYMKERHVDDIFKGENISTKIIFEHKLGNWQNECGVYNLKHQVNSNSLKDITSPINNWLANVDEKASSSSSCTCGYLTEALSVLNVLEKTEQGRSLLKKYKETRAISPDDRILIVHNVIQHVIENERKISVNECRDLAEQIIIIFPTENIDTYFIQDNKRMPPKGKLWDRYQNRQRFLRKLTPTSKRKRKLANEFESVNSVETKINSEELEKISAELKYVRDWEQVLNKWNQTILYRKQKLAENSITLQQILKDWPLFKYSKAPELVNIDYKFSYPDKNFNFSRWEKFCEIAENIFSQKIKDFTSKAFLKKTMEKRHILDRDNLNICFMKLLHAILIPFSKTLQGSFVKHSITDSQNSFTLSAPQASDIEQIVDEKRKNCLKLKSTMQPFIIVVGSEFEYKMFYVSLDDVKFSFETYLEAMQFCFKLMYTLNLKYPNESVTFWTFVQKFLFNIQTQFFKIPAVETFITDLNID